MQTQGMSREQPGRVGYSIDDAYTTAGELPGALVQVWRRDEPALNFVLGLTGREHQMSLTEDSALRIYSVTKPTMSVAFMMLVREYGVTLDDSVSRLTPAWVDLGVHTGDFVRGFQSHPVKRPMRMISLLRYTSGLTHDFYQDTSVDAVYHRLKLDGIATDGTLDEMIEKLTGVPLRFSPSEAWNHPISTDAPGYLVGKISGIPSKTFLKERIFDLLGMVDTAFHAPEEKASHLHACYAMGALDSKAVSEHRPVLQDDPCIGPYLKPPSFISDGDGLVSTVADYLCSSCMLLQDGKLDGARLLAPRTLALTTTNHLPDGRDMSSLSSPSMPSEAACDSVGFGLGFTTTIPQAAMLIPGSTGDFFWDGTVGIFFWADPQEDLIGLFLAQVLPSSAYPVRRRSHILVYSAITDMGGVAR